MRSWKGYAMRLMMIGLALMLAGLPAAARATNAEWRKLVSPEVVATMDVAPLILDIRPASSYARGHIEGAVSAPYGWWRGPAANPGRHLSDAALTGLLRKIGVTHDRPVVVSFTGKNAGDFGSAARVYWTLKSAGVERIAILNGGLRAWTASGLPLTTAETLITPSDIDATLSDEWMLDETGVQDALDGKINARLVDARSQGFFDGRNKHPKAAQAGTLNGALRVLHSSWFAGDDAVMTNTPALAREIAANAGYDGPNSADEALVSFCNTGHLASTNWFALSEIAGIKNVKLYPESLVGWSNRGGEVVKGSE